VGEGSIKSDWPIAQAAIQNSFVGAAQEDNGESRRYLLVKVGQSQGDQMHSDFAYGN
jgi:hypothetical protein